MAEYSFVNCFCKQDRASENFLYGQMKGTMEFVRPKRGMGDHDVNRKNKLLS